MTNPPEGLAATLIQSFILGGLSVMTLSITADRFGSKIAGALGGIPATVALSLVLLGISQGPEEAAEAAVPIPAMMGLMGVLLSLYCGLVHTGIGRALGVSLAIWAMLAWCVLQLGRMPLSVSVSVFLVLLLLSFWLVEHHLGIPSVAGAPVRLSLRQLALRCLTGGALVCSSVYLGIIGGPHIGGIMAACPAVTVSALIMTYQSGGAALSAAFGKSIMLSGMVNVTVYAVATAVFYPLVGLPLGTAAAVLSTCVSGPLLYLFMRTRLA